MKIKSGNGQLNIGSLKKGLVLDLDISSEGLQGTTKFKDKTPYENNGTLSNVTLTTDHKGKANSAGLFNGIDSYIKMSNDDSLDITGGYYTISMWIKREVSATYNEILTQRSGENKILFRNEIGSSSVSFRDWTGTVNILLRAYFVANNEWEHYVLTRNNTEVKLYRNNVLIDSDTTSGTSTSTDNTIYLGSTTSGGVNFTGSIERPQIWNRALSEPEIKTLYESYNPNIKMKTSLPKIKFSKA